MESIKITKNKSFIYIKAKKLSYFGMFIGLIFRHSNYYNLLFDFNRECRTPIHSLFVFFPFLAAWLDERNKIIDFKIVKPFSLSIAPVKKFRKLVEIPINERNKEIIDFIVGKRKI